MAKINRVESVSLSGGIIGFMASNSKKAIEEKLKVLNAEGWYCNQIIEASSPNFLTSVLQNMVLVLTLFLWTFKTGYLLILEKEINSGGVPQKSAENVGDNWVCKKCNTPNNGAAIFCKNCGERK